MSRRGEEESRGGKKSTKHQTPKKPKLAHKLKE
jgi:hypothetical protein